MSNINNNDPFDLGSDSHEDFDPFANEDDFKEEDDGGTTVTSVNETDDNTADTSANATPQQPVKPETQTPPPKQPKTAAATESAVTNGETIDNPLENAIGEAETKEAEKSRQSLYEKPPVFDYAGATEDIEDASQTFDELRIVKAADFPELEDGKRVSWTVEYGKITKSVTDAKGTSIAKVKSEIETSKAFLDALKKSKDKNPDCKVKPRVTAQSKGVASAAGYKGVFTRMADVEAAGKVISILPGRDGKVYEVRRTEMGTFTTPTSGDNLLSDVRAGFARTLPLIPKELLLQIIAFFRYFSRHEKPEDTGGSESRFREAKIMSADNEALLNIYWDKHECEYIIDAPKQVVTKASVNSHISDEYFNERYIHFMDIHSHNTMRAFFSAVDNADEKATRVYAVVGELHKSIPSIRTRISNGGKFLEIEPGEVFEPVGEMFPDEWKEAVQFRKPHGDDKPDTFDVLLCSNLDES